jgi:hypothetical protein
MEHSSPEGAPFLCQSAGSAFLPYKVTVPSGTLVYAYIHISYHTHGHKTPMLHAKLAIVKGLTKH